MLRFLLKTNTYEFVFTYLLYFTYPNGDITKSDLRDLDFDCGTFLKIVESFLALFHTQRMDTFKIIDVFIYNDS